MISLSQTSGYAILALACLDHNEDDKWVKVRSIGECTGIPMPYLAKILHQLGQSGLVVAKRGTFGGYALAVPSDEINLLDVAEAVEGKAWLPECLLGFTECSDARACPTHGFWSKERAKIEAKLKKTTLKDVVRFERGPRGRIRARRGQGRKRRR